MDTLYVFACFSQSFQLGESIVVVIVGTICVLVLVVATIVGVLMTVVGVGTSILLVAVTVPKVPVVLGTHVTTLPVAVSSVAGAIVIALTMDAVTAESIDLAIADPVPVMVFADSIEFLAAVAVAVA